MICRDKWRIQKTASVSIRNGAQGKVSCNPSNARIIVETISRTDIVECGQGRPTLKFGDNGVHFIHFKL